MDGQRTNPSDQDPRWREGEPRYGDPRRREPYGDDPLRVPEPRDGSPERAGESFNGFAERAHGGDASGHRWGGPPYEDEPSWRSQEPTLLPTARPPLPEGPPRPIDTGSHQFGEPFHPNEPVSADPARPVSVEPLEAPTGAMPPITPRDDPRNPGPDPRFPGDESRYHAEAIDRAALRRPPAATVPAGDGVYRTRRPAVALLFAVLTVIFELGAVRVLLDGMFGGPFVASQVVSGMFLVAGLPVFALGLYGTSSGGSRTESGGWAKPPTVYLVAGLGLLIAAALA